MNDPLIVLLSNNRIFHGLTNEDLHEVREAANERRVVAGSYIIRQGDPAQAHYLLLCGSAKLIQSTPDGHQMLMRFIRKGDGYGIAAAFDDLEYVWSVQAIKDCQLLVWPGDVVADMMRRYNQMAINAVRIALIRCRELQHRYVELLTFSVEQRLAQALLRLCGDIGVVTDDGCLLDVPLSREDLAEYTGTTVYSVSRFLQKWERNGWVRSGRERVAVLHQDSLREIVSATV